MVLQSMPPPGPAPDSLRACTSDQLCAFLGSSVTDFAGLACVLDEGPLPLEAVRCGPEVVCWHACFHTFPPENSSVAWAANGRGEYPTGDCGRVRHVGGAAEQLYEYDLSGSAYEELWSRLWGGAGGSSVGGIAMLHLQTPAAMLLVAGDSCPSSVVEELRAAAQCGPSLETPLVDESRPLQARQGFVDCEFSVRRRGIGGCSTVIAAPTFSWRVGKQLSLASMYGVRMSSSHWQRQRTALPRACVSSNWWTDVPVFGSKRSMQWAA